MTKNTFALVLVGGAAIASASLGMAACSSDNTVTPPPGQDSSTADTSPANDAGNTDSANNNDTGTACTHGNPPSLHPSTGGDASLWCGYEPGDSGAKINCDPKTEVCCIGGTQGSGFAPDMCNTIGTPCTNGTGPHELDCEDPATDCPVSGSVCCLTGETPAIDPACNYYYAKSKISTKCVTPDAGGACATGDTQLCTSDGECSGGKKCTPFKTIYFGFGMCM